MSSFNLKINLKNLPLEIILQIGEHLDKRTRTELALTSKSLFQDLTHPSEELYPLKDSISIIDFYKVKNLFIGNRYYQKNFVNHILNHAPNLEILCFAHRKTFPVEFIRLFLNNVRKDRSLVYIVPKELVTQFQMFTKYENLSNITVTSKESLESDIDDDAIVTPVHIKRHVQMIKRDMKLNFFFTDHDNVKFKTNLSHRLPLFCNELFHTKNYVVLLVKMLNTKILDKDITLDLLQAKQLVKEVGPTFVDSVVILQEHWFFITSFSVFIHDPNRIDDCADKSKFSYQNSPVAFIQRKTNYGASSFELVIRLGYIELLANSGFIGSTSSKKLIPFVGSAPQQLPPTISTSIETLITKQIFINKDQQAYTTGNRIINQYYKNCLTLPWQFYSTRFSENDFKPVNPLDFKTRHCWFHAASVVMRTYALKTTDINDIKMILNKINHLNTKPRKLRHSQKLIQQHLMKAIENQEQTVFEKSKEGIVKIKKDLICIHNELLSHGIKLENNQTVKLALEKYKFKEINLFDN